MSEPPLPPIPAMPLGYAYESSQRPGIITAIGVISIIVGSFSILGSGLSGLYGFGMMMIAQVSQAMATASANVPAPAGPATLPVEASDEPTVDPDMGLDADARGVIVKVVADMSGLNVERQDQLDTLLAYRGARIFAFANQPVTVQGVQARITKHGTLPSADPTKRGADFFLTAWGTVEIYDDHAVFRVEGTEPFSVSAGEPPLGSQLTRDQAADAVVTRVRGMATITDRQAKGLRDFIASPTQNIIVDYTRPASEVTIAEVDADGALWVGFNNGDVDIDSSGQVTGSSQYGTGGAGWTGPTFNISKTATTIVILEALASMGLAVYLLVIGILTLRQSLRARSLHWIYVWLKIPLAITCAWAWAALFHSMAASVGGGAPPSWASLTTGVVGAAVACIYPVALIFVLNTKAVKEYYATGG